MPTSARWRSDSAELFYMTADGRIMTVSIHLGSDGGIEAGQPQMLFQTRPRSQELESLRRDAGRPAFLGQYWTSAAPITVVTNWTEKLKE